LFRGKGASVVSGVGPVARQPPNHFSITCLASAAVTSPKSLPNDTVSVENIPCSL
jgi:hypothetical protein